MVVDAPIECGSHIKRPSRTLFVATVVFICLTLCFSALNLFVLKHLMNTTLWQLSWIASSIGWILCVFGLASFCWRSTWGYRCELLACALLWCIHVPLGWMIASGLATGNISGWG